jgi:hypothetical protein
MPETTDKGSIKNYGIFKNGPFRGLSYDASTNHKIREKIFSYPVTQF